MNRTLLWDAAPGEMRAGVVENGKLAEFRIYRSCWHAGATGSHFTARIIGRTSNGKPLVDIGGTIEAQLEQAPKLPEGALLAVELVRMPIAEPGRWKLAIVRPAPDIDMQSAAGPIATDSAMRHFLLPLAEGADRILCGYALAARDLAGLLGGKGPPIAIDSAALDEADFEGLADQAVRGEFPVEGGLLSVERTRAMTLIDIDGGGDPLALNLAAAQQIPRLLRLLDIGGQVGIDFLALPDRAARQRVDIALADSCAVLGPHERTATNGFGFAQIVRPRSRPSIPEILCATTPGRLSVESRAVALLRQAARSVGAGTRRIVAPPATIDVLRAWPDAVGDAATLLGYPIELVSDSSVAGYGHVHVQS
ncbi:MAG: hypothetical protein RLZZ104_1426 [Pseudomonadota bacterium]